MVEDTLENKLDAILHSEEYKETEQEVNNSLLYDDLVRILLKNDKESKIHSLHNILRYKESELSSESLTLYFLCLENIKDILNNSTISIEFNILMEKLKEVQYKESLNSPERELIIKTLTVYTNRFEGCLSNRERVYSQINIFAQNNIALSAFIDSIENILQYGESGLNNWKNHIKKDIKHSMRINCNDSINAVSSYCLFMKRYVDNNPKLSSELKCTLIEIIKANNEVNSFPMIHQISREIDERIVAEFFTKVNSPQDYESKPVLEISKEIRNEYSWFFTISHELYMKTKIGDYPDIQHVLSEFLQQFLEKCYKRDIISYFVERYREDNLLSISNRLQSISNYDKHIQYIIASALIKFADNAYNTLDYLFEKLEAGIKYRTIDRNWAADFIHWASGPPFQAFLLECIGPEHDLLSSLELITNGITIIKLPKGFSGFNLHSCRIIAIKWFKHAPEAKGAIFAIYLHELVHFLLRLDCQFVKEFMSPKSDYKFNAECSEGGEIFETRVFGSVLTQISFEAAEFLASGNLPKSLEEFTARFKSLNEAKPRKRFFSLKNFSNKIFLGACAFRKKLRVHNKEITNS